VYVNLSQSRVLLMRMMSRRWYRAEVAGGGDAGALCDDGQVAELPVRVPGHLRVRVKIMGLIIINTD
jgi:hypothetical protein